MKQLLTCMIIMTLLFSYCQKSDYPTTTGTTAKTITIRKSFSEINLNLEYKFSKEDTSISKVNISGDFSYLDKSTTLYEPEETEYFTIRTEYTDNKNIQCLIGGKYHFKNDSLEIFYVKTDLGKQDSSSKPN